MSRRAICVSLLVLGTLASFISINATAGSLHGGGELRGYPAGIIFGARLNLESGPAQTFMLAAGYNATDRRDFGEHDDETGGGPGFGLGGLHRFGEGEKGWLLGGRLDMWFLEIDWVEAGREGTTHISVLQPTGVAGYGWWREGGSWWVEATLAFGAEINVNSKGDDVGQGAILLAGFAASYRF